MFLRMGRHAPHQSCMNVSNFTGRCLRAACQNDTLLQPACVCGVFCDKYSGLTCRVWPCCYHKQFQHGLLPCPFWACTFSEARLNRKRLSTTRGFAKKCQGGGPRSFTPVSPPDPDDLDTSWSVAVVLQVACGRRTRKQLVGEELGTRSALTYRQTSGVIVFS